MPETKYDSTVSFQGKKLAQVRFAAESKFEDSLLWITVDHHERQFNITVDNFVSPDKIKWFNERFKQCKIKIFKEISLKELMTCTK